MFKLLYWEVEGLLELIFCGVEGFLGADFVGNSISLLS
jgi:hypothetical protein